MKQMTYICSPDRPHRVLNRPWTSWEDSVFNSRDKQLNDEGGLSWFMKNFELPEDGKALLCAAGLGVFDLFCNGKRVGTVQPDGNVIYDELKPGWTDYHVRTMAYCYDLTPFCHTGINCLTAVVSDGWWSGRISFGWYGQKPTAFAARLTITDHAGKLIEEITTGEDWNSLYGGPIRSAGIWDGEWYDATLPSPAVCPEVYQWKAAVRYPDCFPEISERVGPAIREKIALKRRPFSAVRYLGSEEDGSKFGKIHRLSEMTGEDCEAMTIGAGEHLLLDFGQNMVGLPRLTLCASRGTQITGIVAEMLNDSGDPARGCDGPAGSPYIKNYRSALARLVYTASGEETEIYSPAHTFYGFRYLELTADADWTLISAEGRVVGSELAETSSFECSDQGVNRLYENILWGMRGNYLSVPTDCPQRDERLGWTGDTQIFSGAASYLANIDSFMEKWLGDVRDSQQTDGGYTEVAPRVWEDRGGDAAWGDAGLIIPDRLYLMYNTPVSKEHYASLEKYMAFLKALGEDGPRPTYGDWLAYEPTDPRYLSLCYYACDAALMEKYSQRLSTSEGDEYALKAAEYHGLHEQIKKRFASLYIDESGLTQQSQTACLLALKFKMLPENLIEPVKMLLRKKIEDNGCRLSTGFVGTGLLLSTLSEYGMDDLCYSLLLQTDEPSWLCSLRAGATTVWERWNSYTVRSGFGDVGMNSFNHYAYGAAAEWFFSGIAGIRPTEEAPGFEKCLLDPRPDLRQQLPCGQKRITFVKAAYDSVKGRIESSWHWENGKFVWAFSIPEGVTAIVRMPKLSVNGEVHQFVLEQSDGMLWQEGSTAVLSASGHYTVREV